MRLDGWKEISEFLNREIRTCQKWEKSLGLPVHRIDSGSARSRVFAWGRELTDWLENRRLEITEPKPLFPWTKVLAAAVVLLSVFLLLILGPFSLPSSANPAYWTVSGPTLTFFDAEGSRLWSLTLTGQRELAQIYRPDVSMTSTRLVTSRVAIRDTDGDGLNEVACFLFEEDPERRRVAFFDNSGTEIWSVLPQFNVKYTERFIPLEFEATQVVIEDVNNDGAWEVLVLWSHLRRFPSYVAVYALSGELLLSYNNTGRLEHFITRALDEKEDTYLVLGGTNNLLDGDAILAVADGRQRGTAISPPYSLDSGSETELNRLRRYLPLDAPTVKEKAYIRIKTDEFARSLGVKWLSVTEISADRNGIDVRVKYPLLGSAGLYFRFRPDFILTEVSPSADFERAYRQALADGTAELPLEEYLSRKKNDVLRWNGSNWERIDHGQMIAGVQ